MKIRLYNKGLFATFVLYLVWVGCAWAHLDAENLPDSVAIMQYKLMLYLTPDDLTTRNRLAIALYRTNQLEEAKREFTCILESDSMNFDALDGLALVFIRMDKYQEALEYLEKALRINKQDMMLHVHLAALYQKMKLPERAQSELEKARSLASDPIQLENIEKELKILTGR